MRRHQLDHQVSLLTTMVVVNALIVGTDTVCCPVMLTSANTNGYLSQCRHFIVVDMGMALKVSSFWW